MADVELVIKMPEEMYAQIMDETGIDTMLIPYSDIIRNGIPLPKGHGRLIDADRLRSMYSINRANFNTVVGIQKWIDTAPTIIEADEEE